MKKLASLALGIVLLFALTACGTTNGSSPSQAESNSSDTKAVSEMAEVNASTNIQSNGSHKSGKVLIAYFSCTGNTKKIAGYIAKDMTEDQYEIIPEKPYSADDLNYNNPKSRSSLEQKDDSAWPVIAGKVDHMDEYDVVFIGYPIWWGQAPRIISTFLESYDFSGKTVIPFCTSGSSGIEDSVPKLKSRCSDKTTWLAGKRFGGNTEASEVEKWVNSLELR